MDKTINLVVGSTVGTIEINGETVQMLIAPGGSVAKSYGLLQHVGVSSPSAVGDFSFYIYKKVVTTIYIVCDFMMLMCHHIGGYKSGDKLLNERNFIQDSSNVKKASVFFFARPFSSFFYIQ
ncbi:MAG: hypothetical protein KKF00_03235 [Proteobacteria bacterium]|nr:hypothetical protein [Pseudomonadota bacterium]